MKYRLNLGFLAEARFFLPDSGFLAGIWIFCWNMSFSLSVSGGEDLPSTAKIVKSSLKWVWTSLTTATGNGHTHPLCT